MTDMNLAQDLTSFFNDTGWSACRLAREAGIKSVQAITRVQKGERQGMHTKNLEKLWPYLYGDRRPPAQPSPPAQPEQGAA